LKAIIHSPPPRELTRRRKLNRAAAAREGFGAPALFGLPARRELPLDVGRGEKQCAFAADAGV